ncbi:MAG: DUF1489 domain-containing protein [Pseudomonadota bacterium]
MVALHIKKLCVGAEDISDVIVWQTSKTARGTPITHVTRNYPKQADILLQNGSLYWVIKGYFQLRQSIAALERTPIMVPEKGIVQNFCTIVLDKQLWRVEQRPHRPFQGWRYLQGKDAPRDIAPIDVSSIDALNTQMPVAMEQELIKIGVL